MKALKGILLFGISMGVTACFDPPEFPTTPEIDFEGIYFREARAVGERDTLMLTISFRDVNGDLGIITWHPKAIPPPSKKKPGILNFPSSWRSRPHLLANL
jgi:hypothetical protein